MREISYDRDRAIAYARAWALGRNPVYLDFSNLGGDCTNFISQCVFEGVGVMNYSPVGGWYYIDGNHKAPAWTAAAYLRSFLLGNAFVGPYAEVTTRDGIVPGDVIQLRNPMGEYYHSLFVLRVTDNEMYIAAHTNDAYMRALSSYNTQGASFLKILGARQ